MCAVDNHDHGNGYYVPRAVNRNSNTDYSATYELNPSFEYR